MCRPITRHFKCGTCKSYFSKTTGDCIGPRDLVFRCPYCGSNDIEIVQESAVKESLSFIRHKIAKVLK